MTDPYVAEEATWCYFGYTAQKAMLGRTHCSPFLLYGLRHVVGHYNHPNLHAQALEVEALLI